MNPDDRYVMRRRIEQPQPQSVSMPMPSLNGGIGGQGGFGGSQPGGAAGGASAPTGMSNIAGAATPALYAYLIGQGKMIESRNPDSAYGKALLGGLGPSFNQLKEDPIGMGIPTALGFPFLAPFFGSDKARKKKPEFAGLWDGLGLP